MSEQNHRLEKLDQIAHRIMQDWYDRVKENYVTEEESRELGVEPEMKCFHEAGMHRLKFARLRELNVTYGLGSLLQDGKLVVESSVNNKSEGFDYDAFVQRLEDHYWRSRNEKPWTDPDFDRFTYSDLLFFEPRMGQSVRLDIRKDKADIIRLYFTLNPEHEDLLMRRPDVLKDLIENYCLAPLKRIYAESYREVEGLEEEPPEERG